ncbi:hypothetical protein FS837_004552 [Tulasnella sp. UAMH 9824]|nr:hypothetical protein FS837_004552 [Tulasnella sp. UAMH 9824]
MSSFADLMKVAEANTRSSNREALEAAKRKEAAVRQAREEQERKEKAERERQKQMMLQRQEEAKRQEEQRKRKEEEAAKRKEELVKKKAQEAEQSKYGVAGSSKDGSARVRPPNQYIVVSSAALTREEKRMAKDPLMADKIKARKAGMTASRHRKDGRLPGGAINATDSNSSGSPSGSRISSPTANGMTARARLTSSFAPTLTKLNTEKRDTRSIDEITRDLKRGRLGGSGEVDSVLSGEKAQTFGDWFGKKDDGKAVEVGNTKKRSEAGVPGRANGLPATNYPPLKPNASGRAHASSANSSGSTSTNPQARPRPGVAQTKAAGNSSNLKPQMPTMVRKRSRERSSSLDSFIEDDGDSEEERRYAKRKAGAGGRPLDDDLGGDTRELIWQLMGRKRSEYMSRDVDSDDEMEVGGLELEREEMRSARIAKREDAMAEAEEKRREEEKKRRKAERAARK